LEVLYPCPTDELGGLPDHRACRIRDLHSPSAEPIIGDASHDSDLVLVIWRALPRTDPGALETARSDVVQDPVERVAPPLGVGQRSQIPTNDVEEDRGTIFG